jgi:orotate phosphoribosyltransferase
VQLAESGERRILAQRMRERARLTGRFTLRSGAVSEVYWDKYRFESDPALLRAIAQAMVPLLPPNVDRVAGLELGGVPLATALALETGLPALFVRKAAKTYGTANLVEGGCSPGERVIVVEDVITSGGQVCKSVRQIRELGLVAEHVVCVVDRDEGGAGNIAAAGCALIPLFTMGDLECLAAEADGAPQTG